ncbi:MAG: glycosyltransferase family 39 protein, partial [Xanthomonadaceae bacterium]|nr:glycosyltransferase family 39 protein [Xanthomonadaceae bacterium]
IALPWLIAIAFESHGAFYQQSLGHDFGAKLAGGQETHGAPPGYYLVLTTLSFWPATLVLVPAIGFAIARRAEPAIRFLIAWAGGTFLLFEFVPTKLPHYILPAYPALAILGAALIIWPNGEPETRWQTASRYFAAVQFLLGTALLAVGPLVLTHLYGTGVDWISVAAALVTCAVGIASTIQMVRGGARAALTGATLCAAVIYLTLTLAVMPKLNQLWVSPRAAVMVASHALRGDPPPVLAGYTEPSLVFLLGTETRLTDGYGAAESGAAQGGLALIEDGQRQRFLTHLGELGATAAPADSLSGFNYSRGRHVHLTLFRITSPYQITMPPEE